MTTLAIDEGKLSALTLKHGAHSKPEDGLCFMEAVAYVRGQKHSDHPVCVSPCIGAAGRAFNDALPTDEVRNRFLLPLIPVVVGTKTNQKDETRRAWMATDFLVRTIAPAWMECAGLNEGAAKLRGLPELTNAQIARGIQSVIEEANKESFAAWAAARAAAWAAAAPAARAAARAAEGAAAWAAAGAAARAAEGAAARAAARAAAWAAAWAAARAAAWAAAWDAAWAAAWAAAGAAAGDAARAAARAAEGAAAGAAAWAAAGAAAGAAKAPTYDAMYAAAKMRLQPTADRLNLECVELIKRMAAIGRDA